MSLKKTTLNSAKPESSSQSVNSTLYAHLFENNIFFRFSGLGVSEGQVVTRRAQCRVVYAGL